MDTVVCILVRTVCFPRFWGNQSYFRKNYISYEEAACFYWGEAPPILNIFSWKFHGLGLNNNHIIWATPMPFKSINSWNFQENILRIDGAGKWAFYLVGHFEFFVFCLFPMTKTLISQNFVAFSEYMNFNRALTELCVFLAISLWPWFLNELHTDHVSSSLATTYIQSLIFLWTYY